MASTGILNGTIAKIQVAGVTVAHLTSNSLTFDMATRDASTKDSSGWKQSLEGQERVIVMVCHAHSFQKVYLSNEN